MGAVKVGEEEEVFFVVLHLADIRYPFSQTLIAEQKMGLDSSLVSFPPPHAGWLAFHRRLGREGDHLGSLWAFAGSRNFFSSRAADILPTADISLSLSFLPASSSSSAPWLR